MARRYDSRTTIFSPEGRLYQVRRKGEIETRRKRKRKEKRKVATARSLSLSLSLSLPPADPLRSKKRVFEKKSVSFRNGGRKKREESLSFISSFISSRTSLSTPLLSSSLLFFLLSISRDLEQLRSLFLLIVVRETRRRK